MSEPINENTWRKAIDEAARETDLAALGHDTIAVLRDFMPRVAAKLGLEADMDTLDDLEDYLNEPVVYKPSPEIQAFQDDMERLEPVMAECQRIADEGTLLQFHQYFDGDLDTHRQYEITAPPLETVLFGTNDLDQLVAWLKARGALLRRRRAKRGE
jgi:hypothetical protein